MLDTNKRVEGVENTGGAGLLLCIQWLAASLPLQSNKTRGPGILWVEVWGSVSWGAEQGGDVWGMFQRCQERMSGISIWGWNKPQNRSLFGSAGSQRVLLLMLTFPLQMDELQGSVKQLQALMDESTQYLQKVSVQLSKCILWGDHGWGLALSDG
jgi:hypothetical protein